jgi:tetratricopeptide (TPR) repeat protein
MRRRALRFLVAAVMCGAGFVGCRSPARDEAAGTRDPQRQRVVDFWNRLSAATEARTRRDFAGAARLYEEALALEPRHEDGLYYLGQCRRERGQADAARVAFERLLEVNPASARGHLALGALFASPDPSEPMDLANAERHLRRAHEINGEETGPVVRLGEIALLAGASTEARGWFESALRANPKCVEAAFLAGYLGWEEGRETAVLVRRVREAAKLDAPVKGVLSEGDRRDAQRVAAPPLASPLGRLLFGEPVERLRAQAAAGHPISEALVLQEWRELRRLRREHARRAGGGPVG